MGHLDSHCHFDAGEFAPDRSLVADRALSAGITDLVIPGVDVESFERPAFDAPGLRLHRAAGLHPVFDHPPDAMERLERSLQSGRFVALGETGLDKRHRTEYSLSLFSQQLDLAVAYRLPVILHVVHAHEDVLTELRSRPGLWGVVHAYSGNWSVAKRYLELGFKLGLGGLATWPNAWRVREVATRCPEEAFVLETDAPDLSPLWLKGERNEPSALSGIAGAIAELRHQAIERVWALSDANARAVFPRVREGLL